MKTGRMVVLTVLVASLGLAGCNGCAGGKAPGTSSSDKGHKAKGKGKGKADAELAAPPPKDTVTHVLFRDDKKTQVWVEGRSGTRGVQEDSSFWLGDGIAIKENDGWRVMLANDVDYMIPSAPTGEGIAPIAEVLKRETSNPEGYAWVTDQMNNGFTRAFVQIGKDRQRVGMTPGSFSKPVWLEATVPGGEAAKPLAVSGWKKEEDGKSFANTPPEGATPLEVTAPPADKLAAWKTQLAAIRGAPAEIKLARLINLDKDEAPEVLVCVSGGRNAPCYVVDEQDGAERFYVTNLPFEDGGSRPPQFFTVDGTSYVSATTKAEGQSLSSVRVIRSAGTGFTTDNLR